jgi:O-acetyl-ADP-ribose deacetylase (regulator of RNase III)
MAFSCIATGAHEFPKDLACEIAVTTVCKWLTTHEFPEDVVFCCFEDSDADQYRRRLASEGI